MLFNLAVFPLALQLIQPIQLDQDYVEAFPFSEYRIVTSKEQGLFYIDRYDWIKNVLSSGKIWEKEISLLIDKYAQPGTIAIDIGAHIGIHTITMARSVQKDGLVVAFEPQKKMHRELIYNLQLNNCTNVIPLHAAIGSASGFAYLEPLRPDNEGYRRIISAETDEKVTLLRLDDLQLTSVSFIKIDVERHELEVLKGAYQTLMQNRPVMVIEIGSGASMLGEDIDPKRHLVTVIDWLENVLHYAIVPISSATGDYLALPLEIPD